jgi:hypothetical protein
MKKIALVLFAGCLLPLAQAFAEITVGAAVEAAVMFQNIDYADRGADWEPVEDPLWVAGYGRNGGNRAKLSLSFAGDFDDKVGINAGFAFYPWWRDNRQQDILVDIDSIEIGGFSGWYRPFDWFRFTVGSFNIDTLRGKIGGFNWGEYLGLGAGGTDGFFTRFEGKDAVALEFINPLAGLAANISALEGLWAGVMVYDIIEANSINNQSIAGGYTEAKYILENIQAGIGYELPKINDRSIGHFRLQYIGVHNTSNIKRVTDNDNNDSNSGPRAQAAFAFTMIPGLTAEIGGTLSFLVEDPINLVPAMNGDGEIVYYDPIITAGKYLEPHRAALGVQYDFNDTLGFALTLRGGAEINFGGYSHATGSGKVDTGSVTKIWFSPSYKIGGALTVGADLGINILGDELRFDRLNKRGGYRFGYGAFARLDIAPKCFIQGGFALGTGEALGNDRVTPAILDRVITIPVMVQFGL